MNIKKFLEGKRIKQVEVAKAIGASPACFNKFLNGWQRLPAKYLPPLCTYLGISTEEAIHNEVTHDKAGSNHE